VIYIYIYIYNYQVVDSTETWADFIGFNNFENLKRFTPFRRNLKENPSILSIIID
jgi:hypothetical protein